MGENKPGTQRTAQGGGGPSQANPPQGFKVADILIEKQNTEFPKILRELQTTKKKSEHWIWWVFPTERPGASEPEPKTHVTLNDVDYLLQKADMNAWSQILEEIYTLLKAGIAPGAFLPYGNKPNANVIPSIDHGRIHFALKFWLGKAKEKTKQNPRFFNALSNLNKFDWQKGA